MKSVLISIQPQWCEKIFSGEKTIEVRRNRPKLEPPFTVYVYCTKTGMGLYGDRNHYVTDITNFLKGDAAEGFERTSGLHKWNGKVIGSFVCDKIDEYEANERGWYIYPQDETCLLCDEIAHYGKGKPLYGWHITAPKLFDKPRELSEFGITRAPMSWCYVEQAP